LYYYTHIVIYSNRKIIFVTNRNWREYEVYKAGNRFKIVALILLTSVLLIGILNTNISIKAQTTALVNVNESIGGTTDPEPDTYEYADGATVTFTAIPNEDLNFTFFRWIIFANDMPLINTAINPVEITVSAGTTYDIEALFAVPIDPPGVTQRTPAPTDAIVVVLSAAGGTTDPEPAIYRLADATRLDLTAIPDSGWQFSHWVISGFPIEGAHGDYPFDPTPTDNPYVVDHGYGNRYNYQPIFTPIGTAVPTPSPTPTSGEQQMDNTVFMALVVVIIILIVLLIVVGAYAYKKSGK
jgi:hypothetical protein